MSKRKELPVAWGNKIQLVEGAIAPLKAHPYDAGRDLFIQEDRVIQPGTSEYMPAGVKLFLKPGWAAYVMTRSSTFRKGLSVIPSVIDSGYNGEISTIVSNYGSEPIELKRGERISQLLLSPVYDFDNENDTTLIGQDERQADARFGSSGSGLTNLHEVTDGNETEA